MAEILFPLDQADLTFTASGGSSIRRTILPSGVRVLSEQMPGAQSASISFSVAVGSRDETNGHFGSTHFLEHLLFKGTTRRSALDIAVAFDSVGGSSNAATGKEHTSYYARVQDSALPLAVDVIGDMLTSSVIDPKEFENERTVILEELAMNDDDPTDVVHEAFAEAVLGTHELGRPIGGTEATINAVTREAVWEHYQANYRPQDLVVAAAGGVEHGSLIALVEKALLDAGWDLDASAAPVSRRNLAPAQIERGTDLKVIKRPLQQANILLGCQGLIAEDSRRFAMGILNTVLGGGMSSRLFQEIREKRGLAYSVYSFNQGYSDGAYFGLYAGCSPSKAQEVTKLMLGELESIAANGITEHELELAKGNISGGMALKYESTQARMNRLLSAEIINGEFYDLDDSLHHINSVTLEQVQSLAADLIRRDRSLVAVGDVSEKLFQQFI
ncbi:M16 family metallopeptidase [Candidatus Rhodoluna planktonica]|uniref:Zinc protease n=1 Tax=Candidatus Rhodoluna planktonica TaxID=535712 RepID=A0A1D9DZP0_9MICO|nr:pitrilysin family protein [Candidatus Rhodoluna planktonica]AOY56240.1 zinc protease [Candidatus Rhodoluna planktonica]